MIDRAQAGDRSILPQLEQLLKDCPEVWQRCGDLASQAEQAWLNLVAGADLVAAESIRRRLSDLKMDLLQDLHSPTKLERLLVDRIAVCWLQAHAADLEAARCVKPGVTAKVPTAAVSLDRVQGANRRYLTAMKQLATVHKLLGPAGKASKGQERTKTAERSTTLQEN